MIRSDFKNGEGLRIEGSIKDVSAECVLIMRAIFRRNVERYGLEIATGILTNMLVKAIDDRVRKEDVKWDISEEEMMNYTE